MNTLNLRIKNKYRFRSVGTPSGRKSDVANGLYHYDILFLDGQQSKGKLLIQKK
ncbi:MAG: hypothetical protein ACR2IL_11305 [Chitinophagaceae bacterium]